MNWQQVADLRPEPQRRCPDCRRLKHREEFEGKRCISCRKIAMTCRNQCITRKEYLRLMGLGCCAICGATDRLVIDHCHQSGKLRGVLCPPCNQALGLFMDSASRMEDAAEYVRKWTKKHLKFPSTEADIRREVNMRQIRERAKTRHAV